MLLSTFNNMPDFRRDQGKRYDLAPVVTIVCLAILCNAKEITEISTYTTENLSLLKKLLNLRWKKPPSYPTIRRICIFLNERVLEQCFRKFTLNLNISAETEVIALDGKTLRGSYDNSNNSAPIQLISAFLSKHKLILAHADIINDKTNEIPKVQELIKELGLTGQIFTMDALHCQHDTLKAIVESGNDGILQVKNNQKKIYRNCQKLSNGWNPVDQHTSTTKARNREETRTAKVYAKTNYFSSRVGRLWGPYIKKIIKIERTMKRFDTTSQTWQSSYEESHYLSTFHLTAKQANDFVRQHWSIENSLHYVRDQALKEDNLHISQGSANFAKLRSFALNILRVNNVQNIKIELYRNSLNPSRLLNYKFLLN
jgi:predicted transposase YbfD/YdcC